jgi:hypothetical protein
MFIVWFIFVLLATLTIGRHLMMTFRLFEIASSSFAELVHRSPCDEAVKAIGLGEGFAFTYSRKLTDVRHPLDPDRFDRVSVQRRDHLFHPSTT